MGLDCSHDAFHGAYSAFNRFRQAVAKAMGGSYPPHEDKTLDENLWYWGDGFTRSTHPGLYVFFMHSDCDGEISPDDCEKVANELEALLPEIEKFGSGGGHLERAGGLRRVTEKFIAGCREARAANDPLTFG